MRRIKMKNYKSIPIICDGTLCGHDYETCPSELIGKGIELVVLVGESPYRDEIARQRPFVGKAGRILRKYLMLDHYQYLIMNSIMCKPHDVRKNKPTEELIKNCRPVREDLMRMMEDGDTMVSFGRFSQLAIFGRHVDFSEVPYFVKHPTKDFEIPTWACYHPMAPQYNPGLEEKFENILRATGKFKL
jgi:uracil-DNA glycosylase family 4